MELIGSFKDTILFGLALFIFLVVPFIIGVLVGGLFVGMEPSYIPSSVGFAFSIVGAFFMCKFFMFLHAKEKKKSEVNISVKSAPKDSKTVGFGIVFFGVSQLIILMFPVFKENDELQVIFTVLFTVVATVIFHYARNWINARNH